MPIGARKNLLYGLALPVAGKRIAWKQLTRSGDCPSMDAVWRRSRVVGGSMQLFERGRLTGGCFGGMANDSQPVRQDTLFRTASVAKMVTALLVMRLQTLGKLNVEEDVSAFWTRAIRNPNAPDVPIRLKHLLSHTSGIADSPAYFAAFDAPVDADALLDGCFSSDRAGERFRYSNFAAGWVGCLLEARFGASFEALMQRELFAPLNVRATFDASTLQASNAADSYRVLPSAHAFDAASRIARAEPIASPEPQRHYLLASGNLYITAEGLARLCLPMLPDGFLSDECLALMKAPLLGWPDQTVRMSHGMGLLMLDDPSVCPRRLYGHQGFAYGAVNGAFFDEDGRGFVMLDSGASERRVGHLSCLNRDLIRAVWKEQRP